jgi:hypothetical protein
VTYIRHFFLSEHEFIFVYLNVPFATPVKKCFEFPFMIDCCCFHGIPLPIIEDLLQELSKPKVFSKCDVNNGLWHITLDEQSSFETPFGRFRWLKMPFGISLFKALLRGFGSIHRRILPLGFFTITRLETQSVGVTIGFIIPSFSSLWSSLRYCHHLAVTLNEQSSFLTTFKTPFGRFRWLKMQKFHLLQNTFSHFLSEK